MLWLKESVLFHMVVHALANVMWTKQRLFVVPVDYISKRWVVDGLGWWTVG